MPDSEVPFGSYLLVRRIAVGGMAEIYLARSRGAAPDDLLVVKRLLDHISSEPGIVQMFLDEARIAATLDHPNIVKIFNVGSVANQYFLSMEHLVGLDLAKINREFHREQRAMDLEQVLTIGHGVAKALHYAHHHRGRKGELLNIVHRDLSPHNVVLTLEGDVKLVDFGVAKAANALHTSRSGAFIGKLAYMSPEQCVNPERIDSRSDLFSLGIILWELSLGRRLYNVRKLGEYEALRRLTEDPFPDPRLYLPTFPEPAIALLTKSMEKRAADRFQTGNEFASAIESVAAELGLSLDAAKLSDYVAKTLPNVVASVASRLPKVEHTPSRRRPSSIDPQLTPSHSLAPHSSVSHRSGSHSSVSHSSGSHGSPSNSSPSHSSIRGLQPVARVKPTRKSVYSPLKPEHHPKLRGLQRNPNVVWSRIGVGGVSPVVGSETGALKLLAWLAVLVVILALAFALGYALIS